tara:strand:- start:1368 stop:1571 length:204 start_codon:yes stop_codon:yes gene_type:complete
MEKEKNKDRCPVCEVSLYYDVVTTQRVGIMNERGEVNEWKCPFCYSEFDLDDNILYIYGHESASGLA